MNTPELLIWLIPGYFAFLIYRRLNPLPSKQGWEWVFETASAALICFLTARLLLIVGVAWAVSPADLNYWRSLWAEYFPFRYSFSLLLGIFPGSLVAVIVLAISRALGDDVEAMMRRMLEVPTDDLYLFRMREWKSKLVFVTLKSGKVYVGGLEDFTSSPDVPERHFLLTPILSGYRHKDTQQVVFTTEYIGAFATEGKPEPERATAEPTLFPFSEVVSIARFNEPLHNHFVQIGTTVMNPFTLEDEGDDDDGKD